MCFIFTCSLKLNIKYNIDHLYFIIIVMHASNILLTESKYSASLVETLMLK